MKNIYILAMMLVFQVVYAETSQDKFKEKYELAETYFKNKQYDLAIEYYSVAMDIPFFEQAAPTTYDKIALAYYYKGDIANAKKI